MWKTKLYPELLLFDTVAERKTALREAKVRVRWGRWRWQWLLAVVGIYTSIVVALIVFLYRAVSTSVYSYPWTPMLVGGASAGIAGWGLEWMFRRPVRDQLRRELIKRGMPICRRCGYNLTGLSDPRCPECGTSFSDVKTND